MSKLNPKQQAFADEYIITGNAYQSALKAGYKENYAKNAQEKLVEKGGKVSDYIQEKLKEVQTKRHLTINGRSFGYYCFYCKRRTTTL